MERGQSKLNRALDIGCGTGSFAIYLASKGFETVGIDISSDAIKKAKEKAAKRDVNCQFYVRDFLDFEDLRLMIKEPFDFVIDHGCLHSINKQKRSQYLPSLNYVTHPQSLYVLWAFHPDSSNIKFFNNLGSVDPEEVRALFSNDFNIQEERIVSREKRLYLLERK